MRKEFNDSSGCLQDTWQMLRLPAENTHSLLIPSFTHSALSEAMTKSLGIQLRFTPGVNASA